MSSSGASAAQYRLDANSNAISLIADAAALPPSPSAQASPADRIEWSRATILGFIEDYRRQRVLWDPNTKGYHIKQTKYEALKLLSQKYGTEIRSIRSKIKSLRSSFHREHGKVINGRSRGVHYQPMWFAYEAIRFILDGERDADAAAMDAAVDGDVEPASTGTSAALLDSEAADKLALMHSLDLEQLTAAGKQQVEQHEDFAARVAAAVAAVAAAAVAANREREHNMDNDAAASDANSNGGCTVNGSGSGSGSDATASSAAAAAAAAAAAVSAAVTRSSSDLDGESYCNISAEDVKTEIIEHEPELSMLERQTSTPLSTSYYKATDLTYNSRKRKAQLDELDGCDVGGGVGVGIVGGVVGALTLTPIKSTLQSQSAVQQHHHHHQTHAQLNHNQIAFHTLQQHFSHNLSHSSHNGNGHPQLQQQASQQHQQHQQQHQLHLQQQHSNNMAQKRDRDRDLSCSPTNIINNSSSNNNNNNNNSNSSCGSGNSNSSSANNNSSSINNSNNNKNNNNHSSSSLELTTTTATSSSGISSMLATPLKLCSTTTTSSSSGGGGGGNSNNNIGSDHVDEYGVFGEYVAITIRKLKTSKSKIVVKHLINNLLYEAELGKYDQGMPASKEPPQLYKMQ